MELITLHAAKTHNMRRPLPDDIVEKVNRQIKNRPNIKRNGLVPQWLPVS